MAVSPETYMISAILNTNGMKTALGAGISSEMFHAYPEEWAWIEWYYTKYRRTPTKVAFLRKFPEFVVKKTDDLEHFADEVKKSHTRSLLTAALRDTTDLIAAGEVDKAIATMRTSTIQAASAVGSIRDTDILIDYRDIYEEVKVRKDNFDENGMAGIPTGFDTIDDRTGGVQRGQSWIVGARLGEGKTMVMLRIAVAAVIAGYNVQFDALEMSRPEVGMRIHNFMSSSVGKTIFQSLSLAQGKDFDIRAYRQFLRDLSALQKGHLFVSDDVRIGAPEIAAQVERNKPDILLFDYLTLGKTGGDGGWQDIGKFSKDLKLIAKSYDIAVVSAAQLNRGMGIGRDVAGAEALAESDKIGQDADAVINLKKRSAHITEAKMVKYRHGPSGFRFWINTDHTLGKMEEVPYNKAQDIIAQDKEAQALEEENSR